MKPPVHMYWECISQWRWCYPEAIYYSCHLTNSGLMSLCIVCEGLLFIQILYLRLHKYHIIPQMWNLSLFRFPHHIHLLLRAGESHQIGTVYTLYTIIIYHYLKGCVWSFHSKDWLWGRTKLYEPWKWIKCSSTTLSHC